ncbi:MAG: hypothetical protein ACRDV6_02355 [Acidimicrobiales bacterium]
MAGQPDELEEELEPMFGQWRPDPVAPAGGRLPGAVGVLEGAVVADPDEPDEVELDDPVPEVVALEVPEVEPELDDVVVVGVVDEVAA